MISSIIFLISSDSFTYVLCRCLWAVTSVESLYHTAAQRCLIRAVDSVSTGSAVHPQSQKSPVALAVVNHFHAVPSANEHGHPCVQLPRVTDGSFKVLLDIWYHNVNVFSSLWDSSRPSYQHRKSRWESRSHTRQKNSHSLITGSPGATTAGTVVHAGHMLSWFR